MNNHCAFWFIFLLLPEMKIFWHFVTNISELITITAVNNNARQQL